MNQNTGCPSSPQSALKEVPASRDQKKRNERAYAYLEAAVAKQTSKQASSANLGRGRKSTVNYQRFLSVVLLPVHSVWGNIYAQVLLQTNGLPF